MTLLSRGRPRWPIISTMVEGRADDRLDRPGRDQDVEQGQGCRRTGLVEAENIHAAKIRRPLRGTTSAVETRLAK